MSLYNYLVKSNKPAQEIRSDFRREEVEQLYKLLKELGHPKYHAFVRERQQDICKYVELSESQRQQKKWANHPDILLIRFAALHLSESTVELLRDMENLANIVDRGSYRQFHAELAHALFQRIVRPPFYRFPFEGFDNPFQT